MIVYALMTYCPESEDELFTDWINQGVFSTREKAMNRGTELRKAFNELEKDPSIQIKEWEVM